MKPLLVLVHGWGFGPEIWDRFRAAFSPDTCLAWDLGFFGPACCPPPDQNRLVIAIGHSFGLLWLAKTRPFPWRVLIGINGFTRFTQDRDFLAGIPPRVLVRMQSRFAEAPGETVAQFRARVGADPGLPGPPDQNALAAALCHLRDWHMDTPPDLALCGRADPLIPPAMSEACFPAPIIWSEGGHLLPDQNPAWCAARLRECLARLA